MSRLILLILIFFVSTNIKSQYFNGFGNAFSIYQGINNSSVFCDTSKHKVYFTGEHRRYFTDPINDAILEWDGDTLKPILTINDITNPDAFGSVITFQNQIYALGNNGSYFPSKLVSIMKYDGIHWDTLSVSPNDYITTATVYNNRLYVAGVFTKIGSQPCKYIAYLDSIGWHPLDQGICSRFDNPYQIYSLQFFRDTLYMGGLFYDTCNKNMFSIARYYSNSWHEVPDIQNRFSTLSIYDLEVYHDKLYAAGNINRADGWNIACFNGSEWVCPGGGSKNAQNLPFGSLCVASDKLYASGAFDNVGGINVVTLASWDDHQWCSIDTEKITDNTSMQLSEMNDTIYFSCTVANGLNFHDNHGFWTGKGNTVNCGSFWTDINPTAENPSFYLSPNPAYSIISIQTNLRDISTKVYDLAGRVYLIPISENVLDIKALPAGIYYVEVRNKQNRLFQKFIKL